MTSKRRAKTATKRTRPAIRGSLLEGVRPWLLAAFVAMCVARPLVPSEGVSWLGDDLPFDMLLMVVAAGYFLWAAIRGGLARPLGLADALVAALVVACVASALIGASDGSPRFAINMLWQWVGLGLVYFLTRQLVGTGQDARALVAVMFALAVVLAVFGFYQVLVSLPADRAAYAADPDQVMLRSLGHVYAADSPERLRFEDRLRSTEPLATFALTNSLAGFLAPWLVMALGIGWSALAIRRPPDGGADQAKELGAPIGLARKVAFAVAILIVAACFLLTKSRSGYVALAVGLTLLPFLGGAGRRRPLGKFALASAVAIMVLAAVAVATGRLDLQVLTEAAKSLEFRWQYWRATLAMIARHPWLGVGPGNFQDYYTQFKLPQASEEIRDPHNFLLEVWATGGTFALVALVGLLGTLAWQMWHAAEREKPRGDKGPGEPPAKVSIRDAAFIVGGAAAGLLLAFVVGPLFGYALTEGQIVCGLLVGGFVVAVLWPWLVEGSLPPRLPALGALVLAIHLLASGGIAFPGVAGTFWILTALALGEVASPEIARSPRPHRLTARLVPVLGFALACGAAAACHYTAYAPVLRLQQTMTVAEGVPHPQARIVALLDATAADPLSADPWIMIAELELNQIKQHRDSRAHYQHFLDVTKRVLELRPRSSAVWRQVGLWYVEVYRHKHDPRAIESALDCLRTAVELYPNSAELRGDLALALALEERTDAARRQAERALALDDQMPHADKKLPTDVRRRLQSLVEAVR